MLVSPKRMLSRARTQNYAIGAFNISNMEIAEAVVEAAVRLRSPVILQTSEGAIQYAGMAMLGAIVHTLANDAPIPIAFHLDHGSDPDLVLAAIRSGLYTSVMIDGSRRSLPDNIRITKEVVRRAHAKRIYVEAEIGAIPGKEDFVRVKNRAAFLTDPEDAGRFVKETGCDALAVAIGTAHGTNKGARTVHLDFARLAEIRKRVRCPLVLHGASGIRTADVARARRYGATLRDAHGIPDAQIRSAINGGICKINIDSDLRIAFTGAADQAMTTHPDIIDPRSYLGAARTAVTKLVMQKLKQFGSVQAV